MKVPTEAETCDTDDDIRITNDTFRVIWAYSLTDPVDEEVGVLVKRAVQCRFKPLKNL